MNFSRYLPFLGFQTFPVDNAGNPTEVDGAHFEADFLCAEWFGYGVATLRGQVRPRA